MKTPVILLLMASIASAVQCKSGREQAPSADLEVVQQLGNEPSAKEMAAPVMEMEVANEMAPGTSEMNILPEKTSQKIIKDGTMQIAVKDLQESKTEVDSLVAKFKGYYSNESFSNNDYADEFILTIRVPSLRFDTFVAQIEAGAGEVVYKNIASRDVTEEFIDLEIRLKNKKGHLSQYGELLKKTSTVKDIVEIQEITRKLEEEIESVEGRLKYLTNQVDYSTLNLTISKSNYNKYTRTHGNFTDRLKSALIKGWFGLVSFLLFVIKIWPFWIICGILFYLYKRVILKRNKK